MDPFYRRDGKPLLTNELDDGPAGLTSLEDFTLERPTKRISVEASEYTVALHLSNFLEGRVKYEASKSTGTWCVWNGRYWYMSGGAQNQIRSAFQRLVGGHAVIGTTVYPTKRIIVHRVVKLTPQTAAKRVAAGELIEDPDAKGTYLHKKTGKPCITENVEDTKWPGATRNMMGTVKQLESMWNVTRHEGDEWDADAHLLNTPDGTIDLDAMAIRGHRSTDLITKSTKSTYDEYAEAPEFRRFVQEVLPDPEVRRYTQQVMGSTLSGRVRDHHLIAMVGEGRNGKSVFLRIVSEALGGYANELPGQVLVERHGESHPTELMSLRGARLVTSVETKSGQRWDVNRLKGLTGGDLVKARAMYEDFVTFEPTHQLVVATNHRPTVSPGESAFWKRYREIPFTQTFVGAKADLDLPTRIIENELDGVLTWLLEGWKDYSQNGLREPDVVTQASNDAAANSSTFAVFVRDCFEAEAGAEVVIGDVFMAWRNYRASETDNPHQRPNQAKDVGPAVLGELSSAGMKGEYVPRRGGGRPAKIVGIKLTDEAHEWLKPPNPFGIR